MAANKEAAGEPAAQSTGRHHNVREDIGPVVARRRCGALIPATSKPVTVLTVNP